MEAEITIQGSILYIEDELAEFIFLPQYGKQIIIIKALPQSFHSFIHLEATICNFTLII